MAFFKKELPVWYIERAPERAKDIIHCFLNDHHLLENDGEILKMYLDQNTDRDKQWREEVEKVGVSAWGLKEWERIKSK